MPQNAENESEGVGSSQEGEGEEDRHAEEAGGTEANAME